MTADAWPALPYDEWKDTCTTLHLWTQIVGKVRMCQMPWINHSWHVTLYVTSRGLTTSPIPYGVRTLQINFDFIDHRLRIMTSAGQVRELALEPKSVAEFYAELFDALRALEIEVRIHDRPNEVEPAIPFHQDQEHASYDREYVNRFWRVLVQVDRVFRAFRAGYIGKVSPVHFFWGSFDLAVTRFSGRPAPEHPGGIPNLPDRITREAYSHEVSSAGFWPGGAAAPYPIFYSYSYPTPEGFAEARVGPPGARFVAELGEFVLRYDTVRQANDPDAALMEFLLSTYEAAANLAAWDRATLELRATP